MCVWFLPKGNDIESLVGIIERGLIQTIIIKGFKNFFKQKKTLRHKMVPSSCILACETAIYRVEM